MKTILLTPLALTLAALPLAAQTAKPTTPHTTASTHRITAAPACAKLPELSPKIPALPAGMTCAKTLYTITSTPSVKLENISPLEGPDLHEILGIVPNSFSLTYIDTKVGSGPLALAKKWYSIHYTGYLLDGTKFDSSLDRGEPISIPYGEHQVIPGWDTGFAGMHVGGKRRLFIPFQLAYGATAHGPIPARSELVFDVELLGQSDTKPEPKPAPAAVKPTPTPGAAPGSNPTMPHSGAGAGSDAPPSNSTPATPRSTETPGASPGSNPTVPTTGGKIGSSSTMPKTTPTPGASPGSNPTVPPPEPSK